MAEIRLQRLCDVCGQLDDHPRDIKAVSPDTPGTVPDDAFLDSLPLNVPAKAVAELMDPTTQVRHIDCCASRGCEACLKVLDLTHGAHGDALTKAIQSGVANIPTEV